MKRKSVISDVQTSLDYLNFLLVPGRTGVFDFPSLHSDCPDYSISTSSYIRDKRLRLYLTSRVIPRLESALSELSKK